MSTGLFPQEFIITFGSLMSVSLVRVQSTNGKSSTMRETMCVCVCVCVRVCVCVCM